MLIVVRHVNSLRLGKIYFMRARGLSWNRLRVGAATCTLIVDLTILPGRWALVSLIYHLLICAQKVWILLNLFSLISRGSSWSGLVSLTLLLNQRLLHHNLLLLSWILPLMLITDKLLLLILLCLICILYWSGSFAIWGATIINVYDELFSWEVVWIEIELLGLT